MKKFLVQCLLGLCLTVKGFSFGGYSEGCVGQNFCCTREFAAEWLYMLSSIDQPFFVQEDIDLAPDFQPFGRRLANDQRWHAGYRLMGRFLLPCSCEDYVVARFTHFPRFENRRTRAFTDLSVGAILIHPDNALVGQGTASIRNRFNFLTLEALWGRPIYCDFGFAFDLQFGVQWAHIDFKERALYKANEVAVVRNKASFNGFGPELALDFSYCLCPCVSIRGRSLFGFLVNKRQARFDEAFTTGGVTTFYSVDNDKYWHGTPVFGCRFGLNYDTRLILWCFQNLRFQIEAGYEFIHYVKAVDRILFVSFFNEATSFVQHQDFTLHGPYLHLGICF